MIELHQITKKYQGPNGKTITALHEISMQVARGEIFGVIGKSGAGKSTLIRCVNMLEQPTSGQVIVDGQDLTQLNAAQLRAARHRIGMIFQHFNLLNTRTVFDNIALPLELIGKNRHDIKKRVMPLIDLVGLTARDRAYPHQLSGGQKQRVAIARALATEPQVLLCDEMTSALDPDTTQAILELIKTINEQLALSILLITHEMGVIKTMADHVGVIEQGKIVESNDVVSIFKNPQHDTTRRFTQSALHIAIPPLIAKHLTQTPMQNSCALLRIAYLGRSAGEPIIFHLINQLGLKVNILQANLEYLHHDIIGVMLVAIQAQPEQLTAAQHYLTTQQLNVEVLGYVPSTHWRIN